MLDLVGAKIKSVSLHYVGNKSRSEDLIYADKKLDIDHDLESALLKFLLVPFSGKDNFYAFTHHEDVKFNEVKSYIDSMFKEESTFLNESRKIADHLYMSSLHPNIKSGELFVVAFSGITLNGRNVDVIGIFKSEVKDEYIRYEHNEKSFIASLDKGAGLNSLDKGMLVYLDGSDQRILVLDKKSADSQYWLENFLNVKAYSTDSLMTEKIMESCVLYSKSKVNDAVESKTVMLANNYISEYFSNTEVFNSEEFFASDEIVSLGDEFKSYVSEKVEESGVSIDSQFEVDHKRVAKISKKIKNIVKLDTGVELKINKSNKSSIESLEKGFDADRNMHFYKVYFNEEIN